MKFQATVQTAVRDSRGMTLLELMTAVSLLLLIVLGLYQMFDQTQLAMRQGATQVDVTETGRSATQLMVRDLEHATTTRLPGETNFHVALVGGTTPLLQLLIDGDERRHELQEFFLLSRSDHWEGIGYLVQAASPRPADQMLFQNGVGTLYRFQVATNILRMRDNNLLDLFLNPPGTNLFQRVADGVVHLNIRAYTNGTMVASNTAPFGPLPEFGLTNEVSPSHIEIEFGVIEPAVLEQARAIPNQVGQSNLLYRSSGNVHMFRRRLPIPEGLSSETL